MPLSESTSGCRVITGKALSNRLLEEQSHEDDDEGVPTALGKV